MTINHGDAFRAGPTIGFSQRSRQGSDVVFAPFNAAMAMFGLLLRSQTAGFEVLVAVRFEGLLNHPIQAALIRFDRHHVFGLSFNQRSGGGLLTVHGIERDYGPGQFQHLQ